MLNHPFERIRTTHPFHRGYDAVGLDGMHLLYPRRGSLALQARIDPRAGLSAGVVLLSNGELAPEAVCAAVARLCDAVAPPELRPEESRVLWRAPAAFWVESTREPPGPREVEGEDGLPEYVFPTLQLEEGWRLWRWWGAFGPLKHGKRILGRLSFPEVRAQDAADTALWVAEGGGELVGLINNRRRAAIVCSPLTGRRVIFPV